MAACIAYSSLECYEALHTLFYEFHGSHVAGAEQAEAVKAISEGFGGGDFRWTGKPEERSRLWQARNDAYYAALALRPGKRAIATDACVPISKLAECLLETRRDIDESGMTAPIVGHVGDGNFHLVIEIGRESCRERVCPYV